MATGGTAIEYPHRRGARSRHLSGRRLAALAALVVVLGLGIVWTVSLRVIDTTPDPYGVGALARARFRQEYPRGIPLTVRVAHTTIGWLGVCEGLAWLDGERVPGAILRPDGSLYLARYGVGRGLWVVDAEVTRGLSLRQIGLGQLSSGPLPPWRWLLPLGAARPLDGSLR